MTEAPDNTMVADREVADDEDLTRTITAILAADVAGYSRLIAANEEGTLRRFSDYARVFRDAIARSKGRVFNTAGDAILAEFPSAVAALRTGIEVQEALRERNAPLPVTERLQFRMGINVGDVVERNGDLLGDGVNIAARLEGIAEPGGICISRSVHEAVGNKVPARFKDMGRQKLKNIAQPVQAYRVRPLSDPDTDRSVRGSVITAGLLLLLMGGGAAAWVFRDKPPVSWLIPAVQEKKATAAAPPRTALAVSVARPEKKCFADTVRVTGNFQPRREVEVRPPGDGMKVVKVLAKPLAEVAAGDVLAELEPVGRRDASTVTVKAPVAGIVGKSNATENALTGSAGPALFTIIPDGEMEFAADVPGGSVDKLAAGQSASITALGLYPAVTGKVRYVSRSVEAQNQLGRASISVDANKDLRWGLFGRGNIRIGESCGLAVPVSSVIYAGDGAAVYVAVSNVVEARPVQIGLSSGGELEIQSGLAPNDLVIQRAGPFLREGDRIAAVTVGTRSIDPQ